MANTTTSTTSGISPEFMPYYSALFNQAQRNIFTTDPTGKITGQKQFEPYAGPTVAGFTPQQLAVQQQVANMQQPGGFGQAQQGLNTAQMMAFGAGNQGLNQAFNYQPQAPQSLAISPQRWAISGANPPRPQQAQQPQMSNIAQMLRQYFQQQGQQQPMQQQPMQQQPMQQQPQAPLTGAAAFNAEFSRLNPGIPINRKWDAAGQQAYIQDLLKRQAAQGGTQYKAPQGFAFGGLVGQTKTSPYAGLPGFPATTPTTPTTSTTAPLTTNSATTGFGTAQTPQQQSAFQQGMGISNVNGQLTFADNASPFVSSANPDPTAEINRRIAMRDNPTAQNPFPTPYTQPDNGNGGFGPPQSQPIQPSATDEYGQPDISQYESKYQQGVTDVALKQAQKQADLQRQQNAMGSIGRGTFGGARQALIQSEGDYNTAQNLANIQAMGSQAGLQNAQQQFGADRLADFNRSVQNQQTALKQQEMAHQGQQFQAGIGRDLGLAGLQYGVGASTNLVQLGSQQQQSDLARLQAQGMSAAQAQALQQQQNDLAMQNYYRAQQYPMQQLGQYSDLLRGNQAGMGTVGTSTTPGGSTAGQIAGGLLAAGGIYGQNAKAINSGISGLYNTFFGPAS